MLGTLRQERREECSRRTKSRISADRQRERVVIEPKDRTEGAETAPSQDVRTSRAVHSPHHLAHFPLDQLIGTNSRIANEMSSIEGGTGSIAAIYADSHCAAEITPAAALISSSVPAALISSSVPAPPVNHAAIDTGSPSTIKDRCAVVRQRLHRQRMYIALEQRNDPIQVRHLTSGRELGRRQETVSIGSEHPQLALGKKLTDPRRRDTEWAGGISAIIVAAKQISVFHQESEIIVPGSRPRHTTVCSRGLQNIHREWQSTPDRPAPCRSLTRPRRPPLAMPPRLTFLAHHRDHDMHHVRWSWRRRYRPETPLDACNALTGNCTDRP